MWRNGQALVRKWLLVSVSRQWWSVWFSFDLSVWWKWDIVTWQQWWISHDDVIVCTLLVTGKIQVSYRYGILDHLCRLSTGVTTREDSSCHLHFRVCWLYIFCETSFFLVIVSYVVSCLIWHGSGVVRVFCSPGYLLFNVKCFVSSVTRNSFLQ